MGGFGDLGERGGQKKVNLGREWVEAEDQGKFSCEKLRAVLAVLLVVAVCQNTLQKFKSMQQYRKPDFRTSGIYSEPPFGRPTLGWGPTEVPVNHLWWPLHVSPLDVLTINNPRVLSLKTKIGPH